MGGNHSVLATADCNTKKKFLCDIRKKQTAGLAMQQECMEIWGITTSELYLVGCTLLFIKSSCSGNIDAMQMAGVTSANYSHDLKVLYLFIISIYTFISLM
jgi:hypothetical protein